MSRVYCCYKREEIRYVRFANAVSNHMQYESDWRDCDYFGSAGTAAFSASSQNI